MYKRYRRSKKAAIPSWLLLLLLIFALAATTAPALLQKSYLLIPVIFALAIIAIIAATIFLWQMEKRKRAKLRALQLADIDRMSGIEFEQYIGTILRSQGYSVSYTATTGDYGVDLLAEKDHIKYAIQAKRYTATVGNHAIMEAVAGMQHYHCNKAVVITSNYFTLHARIQAASSNCILIDRDKLAEWILAFQNPQNTKLSFD